MSGSLACFDGLQARTTDGDDPLNNTADNFKTYPSSHFRQQPARQLDALTQCRSRSSPSTWVEAHCAEIR
jgi:hypothetical protein